MRKNRVPFFSKSYCREMLREFSTTGIVFASIEFVASMLSFFGITQNLLSMLLFGANVYIQSSAVSYVSLFCFVAGFVFVVKHLVRSAWDFRGSIPVAKRTMLISAFTAMLAWAGICAAANILGAFVGSLVSTISNSSVLVPSFAMVAEAIGESLLRGLMLFGGFVLVFSLSTRTFPTIVLAFVCLLLPNIAYNALMNNTESAFTFTELLFPVSPAASTFLNCLVRVLCCAAVLIAAYFAFVNAQAETAGKPARTRWIHVLISIGFALTASLMFTNDVFYPDVYSGSPQIAWNHLIAPAIVGVVVYFGFSWITLRRFKSAVKRLMFFPVVLAGVAIVLLCSAAMTKVSEKIEIRASNIEYVTVQGGLIPSSGFYSLCWRGNKDSERMQLHDEMLFDYCEQLSKADFDYISTYAYTSSESQIIGHSLFNPSSVIRSLDRFENTVTLAVKLKSGQTYYYPASLDSYDYSWKNEEFTLRDILLMNTDYVESNVNLSRFENGKVALPHGLDANFHDTLMRELKALDSDKLLHQFGIGGEDDGDSAEFMNPWSFMESGEFGNDFQFAVLSDISGNYCRVVAVDENTPESLRMLISYENRKTEKKRGFNETLSALESGSFNIVGGSISGLDDMFQSNFVYFNVDGMNPPALAQQAYVNRETIDTLLNCIEQSRGKTPEPGQHVLSVWFSTIASGRYNSELDDGMYDKSFIDDYGYIDRYTLSELGIEYSDAGTLHYFIFVDDAAYSRILQLFSNMHGGVADA